MVAEDTVITVTCVKFTGQIQTDTAKLSEISLWRQALPCSGHTDVRHVIIQQGNALLESSASKAASVLCILRRQAGQRPESG